MAENATRRKGGGGGGGVGGGGGGGGGGWRMRANRGETKNNEQILKTIILLFLKLHERKKTMVSKEGTGIENTPEQNPPTPSVEKKILFLCDHPDAKGESKMRTTVKDLRISGPRPKEGETGRYVSHMNRHEKAVCGEKETAPVQGLRGERKGTPLSVPKLNGYCGCLLTRERSSNTPSRLGGLKWGSRYNEERKSDMGGRSSRHVGNPFIMQDPPKQWERGRSVQTPENSKKEGKKKEEQERKNRMNKVECMPGIFKGFHRKVRKGEKGKGK